MMGKVMTKALTLSIVIPAYNEESYISQCLDAIAQQTVTPDEVIVVDNNSTDATATIAARYPFVTLISETRQGLYFSRQAGMAAAGGGIICRIDADTVVDQHWVENIKLVFEDHEIDALTGPVGYHDFILPLFGRWCEDKFLRLALAMDYDFMFGCNMAMRRSVWQKVAPELCNESYLMEDLDITLHLKEHGIYPAYSDAMSVLVSSRRAEDKPRDFYRYITGHSRTMKHHDHSVLGARYAEVSFITAYLLLKPLHMLYDPVTRRLSMRKLLAPSIARPDPMTGEAE